MLLLRGMNQAGMGQGRADQQGRADHMPRHSSGHCLGAEATAVGSAHGEATSPTMSRNESQIGKNQGKYPACCPKI